MFNETTIKILFLFLPGIISTAILQIFNEKNERFSIKEYFVYSFIFGIISYLLYSFTPWNNNPDIFYSLITYDNKSFPLRTKDIFFLSAFGVALGILFCFIRNCGITHLVANKFKISYETGFKNVLTTIYKSNDKDAQMLRKCYAMVKLLDGTADYYGYLKYYEIHENYTEICLCKDDKSGEVDINFTKNLGNSKEYRQNGVYLNLLNGTFTIEFAS